MLLKLGHKTDWKDGKQWFWALLEIQNAGASVELTLC